MFPIIGINPTQKWGATEVPGFKLGECAGYDDPTLGFQGFVFGRANGAITGAGYICVEQTGFDFALASLTSTAPGASGHGTRVAGAMGALADNEYGWFQIYGKGNVRCLGATAIGTRLNSSSTGGAVDDAGTVGSEAINGLVIMTLTAGDATCPDGMYSFPTVGATL